MSTAAGEQIEIDGVMYPVARSTATLSIARAIPEGSMKAAAAMGLPILPHPGLLWVYFILDAEGKNDNWDYMPRPSMLEYFGSAVLKPFDMEHLVKEENSLVGVNKNSPMQRNTIFGVMTSAAIADVNGNILTAEAIGKIDKKDDPYRDPKDRLTVVAWAALWSFKFPKTVKAMESHIESGSVKVSMDRIITMCDFVVHDESGKPFTIDFPTANSNGIWSRWQVHQSYNNMPIYRRSLSFIYGGVAGTFTPAQNACKFLPIPQTVSHPASASDQILDNLQARHDELHNRWPISSFDERSTITAEHAVVTQQIADRKVVLAASVSNA